MTMMIERCRAGARSSAATMFAVLATSQPPVPNRIQRLSEWPHEGLILGKKVPMAVSRIMAQSH